MLLQWKASNSVGVKELDNHHKKFIDIISDLSTGVNSKFKMEAAELAISDIRAHAKMHFEVEERMMDAAGFPGLVQHRLEHLKFFEDIDALAKKLREGNESAPHELLDYMTSYIVKHIGTLDKAYAPYLKNGKAMETSRA